MGKSIALFGTSADPPTIGHKKILEELSKIYAFTIGYVSNIPNKIDKEDISIRSHLLKTLIEDLDNPKILFNQRLSSKWAVESIKKCKKIYEFNNLSLGVTQIGVNTSINLIKKVILLTAPFTNGLSLLPYGPIAIIQAAIAIHSTKILGKLAAKEIFIRSKASFIEPAILIQNMNFNDPEILNYINIYFSNRNLNNNFVRVLP